MRLLVPAGKREFVLGDLEELHALRARRDGRHSADRRYWRDALGSIRALVARSERPTTAPGDASPLGRGGSSREGRGPVEAMHDLGEVVRGFARHPRFYALVMLTLALGVGSAAAVFGMVDQLILRPLPGTAPTPGTGYLQLRSISRPERTQGQGLGLREFDEIRSGATLFEGMASYGFISLHVSRGDGRPVAVLGNRVYGDFFEVLGARAEEGRLLRADETGVDADSRVAVISGELRRSLFGEEPAVGRTLLVNGVSVTILGVVAGGFRGPERGIETDIWVPHSALVTLVGFAPERLTDPGSTMHSDIIARIRDRVRPEAAEAQVAQLLGRLAAEHPESAERLDDLRPWMARGLEVPPIIRATTHRSVRLLGGVVTLVLLVACANVANLLLFRNVSRRSALATRRALGASPGRIARYHLLESLILGCGGTLSGIAAAWLITLPFRGERILSRLPGFEGFVMDGWVIAFGAALSLLTAVLFGALPAALAGRFDLGAALREGGGGGVRRLSGVRWIMAATQIALTLTLLTGGLLIARTLGELYAVDSGFSIEGVATLSLDETAWQDGTSFQELEDRLSAAVSAVPAVRGVALDLYGPHGSRLMGRIGPAEAPDEEAARATMWPVSSAWFDLLGVELRAGAAPTRQDWVPGAQLPVVLSASLARRLFGTADAVGRRVRAGFSGLDEAVVVGVTGELRSVYTPDRPDEAFFVPIQMSPLGFLSLMVGTTDFDAKVAAGIREAVGGALPGEPVAEPTLLTDRVSSALAERRLLGRLLALLSGFALLLAAVGLYGVIAFTVAGRVRELGIRIALGAAKHRIARLVLRDAVLIVGAGTALGLGGAYLLSAVLESRLFGVGRLDPLSWGGAVLLLTVAAALACVAPARAATRVDPVETLTVE